MLDETLLMRAQMPVGAFGSPSAPQFTLPAPQATPYGAFAWQAPTSLSDAGKFRLATGMNTIQRGAAARGTLLSGRLQERLGALGQGLAAEEADKDFGRALSTYETNRATHGMNFGNQLGSFNAGLGAFGANTGATLDFAKLGMAGADQAYGIGRDVLADERAQQTRNAFFGQQAADDYAREVERQRAASAAADRLAASVLPAVRKPNPAIPRDYRPGAFGAYR